MKEHRLQHPDSPTWCIDCGTFDCYCVSGECDANETGCFNSDEPENWKRVVGSMFAEAIEPEVAK